METTVIPGMNMLISIVLLGMTICDELVPVDWATRAAETSWTWPDRQPSLFECTMSTNEPYQVVLEHIRSDRFLVHIKRDDKLRLKFEAHASTVFDRCRNKFVYAKFNTSSSGCTIIAYDLEAGKQLWESQLEGIGLISHTRYSNRVSLNILHGVVHVCGLESGGKYLEYLDLNSGKVLGRRVFEKGFK